MAKIKLSAKYRPLWSADYDYAIITGGRGSQKSFATGDFIENLTFEQNHIILFTRYTLTSAHISVIPEFVEKITYEGHEQYFNINKTDVVNTATGSSILFRGIKTSSGVQTASLKSIQGVSTWVLDEAEELTEESTFDKIDESIRTTAVKNRVILILNPATKEHWIYKRFFEDKGVPPGFNGIKDNVLYIHTTYEDNIENLSEKFLNNVEKSRVERPDYYNHVILGGWLDSAEGVVFNNWEYGDIDYNIPFGYGMDFGFFPDPDVLIRVAVDNKRKIVYCKEVLAMNNAGMEDLVANIKRVKNDNNIIIADSAENRLIYDIRSKGIHIEPTSKYAGSVLFGIKQMHNYKIVVDRESTNIGKEFNNYVWNDKKSGIPIDAYNHRIDAIRYYVMKYAVDGFFVI